MSINLDWDHFVDVYGERPTDPDYRKKWDGARMHYGGESAPGAKKEVIELRIYDTNQFKSEKVLLNKFYESYAQIRTELEKLGLTAFEYAQFNIWLNSTEDKEVIIKDDHTLFNYYMPESQFEAKYFKKLQIETPDDILLPIGGICA